MLIFDVIDGFEVEWKMMARFSDEIHLDLLGKWMLVQQRMCFYHLPMFVLKVVKLNRLDKHVRKAIMLEYDIA